MWYRNKLKEKASKALNEYFVSPFYITGRPMIGWIMVDNRVYSDKGLVLWLKSAMNFVNTLQPK